jgi:1,4-dihydroxy-2-naphthoate octaprenyltransferase
MTPLSGFVFQTGQLHVFPLLLTLPLIALQLNMLFTLEFPDECGDRSVRKRTWVVIFGARSIAGLSFALIVVAFVFTFFTAGHLLPASVGWAWFCLLPLGIFQAFRLLNGDFKKREVWEPLAFGSVALFFLAIVADLLAVAYASWMLPTV